MPSVDLVMPGAGADRNTPDESPVPDELLVARAQADLPEFDALYLRYVSPVYKYCLLRLRARDAAEDATSEVFLKALSALPRYRAGTFAGWLFRIARNVTIDAYRRGQAPPSTESVPEAADPEPQPYDLVATHVERQALASGLEALGEEQRTVIELGLAGWTERQIADAMGKSIPAIKMLRYRAVRKLQASMRIVNEPQQEEPACTNTKRDKPSC